jgi:hypothetical protein
MSTTLESRLASHQVEYSSLPDFAIRSDPGHVLLDGNEFIGLGKSEGSGRAPLYTIPLHSTGAFEQEKRTLTMTRRCR